jgi:UDP-N-acetylglucosamine acyltransferase
MKQHPTAVISPEAEIADDVEVGPHCVIAENVFIGPGTVIGPNVVIGRNTRMGRNNRVVGNASISSPPQDRTFHGEETRLTLGDENTIREFVTINVGTKKGGGHTRIGSNNLLMACAHVGHDCQLGSRIEMGNNVLLAGHVVIEDAAVIGGGAAMHHFTTVGTCAFIGGLTRIVKDVPPYMKVEGHPSRVRGPNVVGMRRNGFSEEAVTAMKEAYMLLFGGSRLRVEAVAELEAQDDLEPAVRYLLDFLKAADDGHWGRRRQP